MPVRLARRHLFLLRRTDLLFKIRWRFVMLSKVIAIILAYDWRWSETAPDSHSVLYGFPSPSVNCESLLTEEGNNHNEVCIVGWSGRVRSGGGTLHCGYFPYSPKMWPACLVTSTGGNNRFRNQAIGNQSHIVLICLSKSTASICAFQVCLRKVHLFGWRSGTYLIAFCKHRPNPRLRQCLQEDGRLIPSICDSRM